MKTIVLALVLILSGCKTVYVDREVKVPFPVRCEYAEVNKPVMPLSDTGTPSDNVAEKTKKALAEIEARKAYEISLEATLVGCKK